VFFQPALALTDYGNLFNAVEFYRTCKAEDVKPIMGVDVFFCENAQEMRAHKIRQGYHLTLLAENNTGWKNITRIVSASNSPDYFYYRARVDFELLEKHKEGVIVLSGGSLDGAVSYYLYDKKSQNGEVREPAGKFKAESLVRRFKRIFGPDHFFLEVHDTGHSDQPEINANLRRVASKYDLRTVAAGNVHYVEQSDAQAHKTLLAMSTSKYNAATSSVFDFEEFYLKDREELLQTDLEEAELDITLEIADRCDVTIDLKRRRLPKYAFVPEGKDSMQHLTDLALKGMEARGLKSEDGDGTETYVQRLTRELLDIKEMGFADYFLIVHDVVSWTISQGILTGYGRGSAGGSLVSYCLGLTDIDPFDYGLIWERFLNKGRGGLPDIDTDIPRSKRKKVIDYVRQRFGDGNVAQLVTLGSLGAKAVLKEVFRVYGMDFEEANKITSLVPLKNDDHVTITLAEAIEKVPELQAYEEKYKAWFSIARSLEGCYKSTGIHPAAVVISDIPFEESDYPLTRTKDGSMIFGYDMDTVDSLSLLKLDLLGLATLDDIQNTRDMVRERHGIELTRETMPLDDPVTYAMLGQGFTIGIFQIERQLGRTWSKNLQPESVEQLSDLVSLIRPGPMDSGMHTQYRAVKVKGEPPTYVCDELEPILSSTYSGLLYQEQVIEICKRLAGMNLIDADKVRKAMGKKKPEEMRKWQAAFVDGCRETGIAEDVAEEVWTYIENFAGYGFNKSHGVGYALLAYETAYLKANYPTEFLCAKLRNASGDAEKLAPLVYDAKLFDVEVTPPRIEAASPDFVVTGDKSIAFGMSALKGVGKTAIKDLMKISKEVESSDDLFWKLRETKTKLTSAMVVALIRSGVFDTNEDHRVRVLARYRLLEGLTDKEVETVRTLQEAEPQVDDWVRFVKALGDETKVNRIKEKYPVKVPNARRRPKIASLVREYEGCELFDGKPQRIAWEQHYLGISLSGSEADIYRSRNKCVDLVKSGSADTTYEIAVCIDNVREILTKKSDPMAFLTVRDDTYVLDNIVVFPHQFELHQGMLEASNVVKIRGKMDARGSLIVNNISRLK
jgi:DNA polymerase-3 subunit alpha